MDHLERFHVFDALEHAFGPTPEKTGNPNASHTRMFTSDGKVKLRRFVIRIASAGKQQDVFKAEVTSIWEINYLAKYLFDIKAKTPLRVFC